MLYTAVRPNLMFTTQTILGAKETTKPSASTASTGRPVVDRLSEVCDLISRAPLCSGMGGQTGGSVLHAETDGWILGSP